MNNHRILLTSMLLTASATAAESEALRELMGEAAYRQSGIETLSKEQIQVLEAWILDNMSRDTTAAPSPVTPGSAPEETHSPPEAPPEAVATTPSPPPAALPQPRREEEPDVVRSRIDGPFEGWRNNGTLFRLQNGQIWEQRQPSTFITDLDSPEVIIRKRRFGYTMEVPAIDRKVHVRRIR